MTSRYRGENAVPLFTWRGGNCAHHRTIQLSSGRHPPRCCPSPVFTVSDKRVARTGSLLALGYVASSLVERLGSPECVARRRVGRRWRLGGCGEHRSASAAP